MTDQEQVANFIQQHPAEWHLYKCGDRVYGGSLDLWHDEGYLIHLTIRADPSLSVRVFYGGGQIAADWRFADYESILTQIASRVTDAVQIYDGTVAALPIWLRDPVWSELCNRADKLLEAARCPTVATLTQERDQLRDTVARNQWLYHEQINLRAKDQKELAQILGLDPFDPQNTIPALHRAVQHAVEDAQSWRQSQRKR